MTRRGTVSHRGRSTALRVALFALVLAAVVPASAPATVKEQRERLPPAAACTDPVAGVWRSHVYFTHVSSWYISTLTIERDRADPSRLTGTANAEMWEGTAADSEPPPCRPGGQHFRFECDGSGSFDGKILSFGGSNCRLAKTLCGKLDGDILGVVFRGEVDHERQEFQSVINTNESATWHGVPEVFRRTACLEGDRGAPGGRTGSPSTDAGNEAATSRSVDRPGPAPSVDPVASPPPPPRRFGGCSCNCG